MRQQGVAAIAKAANLEHVRENRGALEIELTTKDLDDLEVRRKDCIVRTSSTTRSRRVKAAPQLAVPSCTPLK